MESPVSGVEAGEPHPVRGLGSPGGGGGAGEAEACRMAGHRHSPSQEKDVLDWSQGKLRRPRVTRKLAVPRPE